MTQRSFCQADEMRYTPSLHGLSAIAPFAAGRRISCSGPEKRELFALPGTLPLL
jgi:hypothetical protein